MPEIYKSSEIKEVEELKRVVKSIDGKVQIIADNDHDGICSAILMSEILERLDVKFKVFVRKNRTALSVKDLKKEIKRGFDWIIILDSPYRPDEELVKLGETLKKKIIYIDHHKYEVPEVGENFFWFDFRSFGYKMSCTEIVYRLGKSLFDDFGKFSVILFLGAFSDWFPNNYVINEVKNNFPNLFEKYYPTPPLLRLFCAFSSCDIKFLQKKIGEILEATRNGDYLKLFQIFNEGKRDVKFNAEKRIEDDDITVYLCDNLPGYVATLISGFTDKTVICIQELKDKVRVEVRSRRFNVGKLLEKFGGGGHPEAGGCVIEKELLKELILEIKRKSRLSLEAP